MSVTTILGHKCTEFKSTAQVEMCVIYIFVILSKKFPRLKISLALHKLLELLLNIKGPHDLNYIES